MVKKSFTTALILTILWVTGAVNMQATESNFNAVNTNSGVLTNTQIIYKNIQEKTDNELPSWEAFSTAMQGFNNLRKTSDKVKKNIISVVDFSLPSTEKRFWVIDLDNNEIMFNDYVAHGRNSGNNIANKFSNTPNSNSSSLGFYVTAEKYHGKHGLSLRLDGMDKGFNDNARKRAIVLHGAEYANGEFIKKYGRLGRSLGCPSVPMEIHKNVVNTIYGGSVLLIYSPDENFRVNSKVLNPDAENAVAQG
ncbi:MAG TPA: murein L,D-transpeptidase catalytic domain family protein [Prolixibacteraceae bacterium]|nr:murein L,D-transpeptidase catalytic domain family protein [Prolixibacteraceae bacterium]